MTKQDYINRIMLIMNEAGSIDNSGLEMIGADVTQIDRYIEGSYIDAWRRCIKVMPRIWFKNKKLVTDTSHLFPNLADGTGYVVLPADFYLLSKFQMLTWGKAVYEATVEDDHVAAVQNNEYTRGSQLRPVCTISTIETEAGYNNILKYFSLKKGMSRHSVKEAMYVAVPTDLKDKSPTDDLEISDQVAEPLCYLGASTVFTLLEKYDIAKALEARAAEMFPGISILKGTTTITKQ